MKKLLVITAMAFLSLPFNGAFAQSYTITTVAGNNSLALGYSGDGGQATAAELYHPSDVVVDAAGNLYIADFNNGRIRKVNTRGIITTIAGGGQQTLPEYKGPATDVTLSWPNHIAVDTKGNVYIADERNSLVRKVNTNGIISTIAGTGDQGYTGNGGPATEADLNYPTGVAVDARGSIYIADANNNCIRKVRTSGIIITIIGNGKQSYTGDGGPATAAGLNGPNGVAIDAAGNIYIVGGNNNVIRKVNTFGVITTIAGNTTQGYSGDKGPATKAELNWPVGVAVDAAGNIYIADANNNVIRKVNTRGIITTIAGYYPAGGGYSGDGGRATAAELNYPTGVAIDAKGNIYIADSHNNVIRKLTIRQYK